MECTVLSAELQRQIIFRIAQSVARIYTATGQTERQIAAVAAIILALLNVRIQGKQQMKYRGLAFDKVKQEHKWVYGMPAYGFDTEKIEEIGTPDGDFYDIDPETLGEETEYRDRHKKQMYTGDIVTLTVDGEVREFVVDRATVEREYNTLPGFEGEKIGRAHV